MDKKMMIIAIAIIAIIGIGGYLVLNSATEYHFNDITFKSHDSGIVQNFTENDQYGMHTYTSNETGVIVLNYDEMTYYEMTEAQDVWEYAKQGIYDQTESEVIDGRTIYSAHDPDNDVSYYITTLKKDNKEFLILSQSADETIFIADSIRTE